MTSTFDKLNLRPGERRALVVVALVVFFVVNAVWVWPRFKDWNATQKSLKQARDQMETYDKELRRKKEYESTLRRFTGEAQAVPPEDQAINLMRQYNSIASKTGVIIQGIQRTSMRTNENYVEQSQTISVICEEANLVNFLYQLGQGDSAVRVRELSLRPDVPHQRLQGTVMLAASFQRKAAARAAAPAVVAPAAAAAKLKAAPTPTNTPAKATSPPAKTNAVSRPAVTNAPKT